MNIKDKIIKEAQKKGSICFLEDCYCGGLKWLKKVLDKVEKETFRKMINKDATCELRGYILGKEEGYEEIYKDLMRIANEGGYEELKREVNKYFKKNYANLSVEEQKRIVAECCEAVNDEQKKLIDDFYNNK